MTQEKFEAVISLIAEAKGLRVTRRALLEVVSQAELAYLLSAEVVMRTGHLMQGRLLFGLCPVATENISTMGVEAVYRALQVEADDGPVEADDAGPVEDTPTPEGYALRTSPRYERGEE